MPQSQFDRDQAESKKRINPRFQEAGPKLHLRRKSSKAFHDKRHPIKLFEHLIGCLFMILKTFYPVSWNLFCCACSLRGQGCRGKNIWKKYLAPILSFWIDRWRPCSRDDLGRKHKEWFWGLLLVFLLPTLDFLWN